MSPTHAVELLFVSASAGSSSSSISEGSSGKLLEAGLSQFSSSLLAAILVAFLVKAAGRRDGPLEAHDPPEGVECVESV